MNKIYVVDSQILNTASSCQRQAHYTFDKNLEPIIKPDYFEKGDMLHQMLAEYYKLRKHKSRWQQNNKSHLDIINICINIGRRAAVKMTLKIETIEEVVNTFTEYATHFINDGWDNVIAVEQVASKILYQDDLMTILYQGKLDLVISMPQIPILPIDHKSSSRRGTPNYLSNQFQGYCWLLNVNNIIINKIGFQTSLKPAEKFERPIMSYSPPTLEEWQQQAIYWIKKYIADGEIGFYPPNYTSCDKYAGCIFQKVCARTEDARDFKLATLFQEKSEKWDVGR